MSSPTQSLYSPFSGSLSSGLTEKRVEAARSVQDEWMHEFRNALGNITIAASAAKGRLADLKDAEMAMAMRHIEDGCDRCLRLLRTMP